MDNKIKAEALQNAKSNGQPYVQLFDEEYSKMTQEERSETDDLMAQLLKIIGDEDSEDEIK